ncbi:MAG: hypothetical protein NC548_33130 [Lachnospiraceae bacterium]|nr:hypothetical protein [Lachnospiraceae bacterium]
MKRKALTAICTLGAAVCVGTLGLVCPATAHADDAAAVRIDFADSALYTTAGTVTVGEDGATLSASSSVSTKEKFTSFLLYTEVTAEGGAIEVRFGRNHTLKFTSENRIETTLEKTGGEREFSYGDFKDGGIISLEVLGSTVTVGVSARVAPEEFLYQPVAVYTAENALGEITLAASGATARVSYLHAFSLAGTVEIEPDDYDASDGEYPVKPSKSGEEKKEEKGGLEAWAIALIAVGGVIVVGAAVCATLVLLKRKKGEEETEEASSGTAIEETTEKAVEETNCEEDNRDE